MAMTILNNSATAMSLGELNKNINKLGKALSKVSTGQKIVGASDNASAFAISEKMREQIRSLEQDIQNVQNGSSMLKTAHSGIENIVDELRSLKELAINAANDSNTDADRAIMQKEFDQRRATIDEIATWTNYNGKPLLDGTYGITRPLSSDGSSSGIEFSKGFSAGSSNCIEPDYRYTGYGLTADIAFMGNFGEETEEVGEATDNGIVSDSIFWSDGSGDDESDDEMPAITSTDIAVKMDFSNVLMEEALSNNGFSILCGGCPQFINIRFDAGISSSQSSRDRMPDGSAVPIEYKIGIAGVSGMSQLAKAIYDGVKAIDGAGYTIDIDDSTEIVMLDFNHHVNVMKRNGEYYLTKEESPPLCVCNYLIKENDGDKSFQRPLTIHHGTKSNQAINLYINDVRSKALGINEAEVVTRQKAISAIGIIDTAIDYTLGEDTYIGAYLQRLEYTEANVTTQDENVQAAESTIRDADMAKEMTEYTKQNVLSQAAQSMLAQANQNFSSVLGLLQ